MSYSKALFLFDFYLIMCYYVNSAVYMYIERQLSKSRTLGKKRKESTMKNRDSRIGDLIVISLIIISVMTLINYIFPLPTFLKLLIAIGIVISLMIESSRRKKR